MLGRRLPDTDKHSFPLPYEELREGDIWKVCDPEGTWEPNACNLTGCVWMFVGPNGTGLGTLVNHTVREHDDGTVSIRPGDGSSNSILQTYKDRTWHGYVEHNVWSEC